jgi:hypothetical protein
MGFLNTNSLTDKEFKRRRHLSVLVVKVNISMQSCLAGRDSKCRLWLDNSKKSSKS